MPAPPRIFRKVGGGQQCRICNGVNVHVDACPIAVLTETIREIVGNLGTYVADTRDLLENVSQSLDGAEDDTPP